MSETLASLLTAIAAGLRMEAIRLLPDVGGDSGITTSFTTRIARIVEGMIAGVFLAGGE